MRGISVLIALAAIPVVALAQNTCYDTNNMAANLVVRMDVVDNLQDGWATFLSHLTLTNMGPTPMAYGTWEIYMCNIRLFEPATLKPGIVPNPEGVLLGDSGLRVQFVQGTLFKITPTFTFVIHAGQTLVVPFVASNWQISVSDSMPNWYVTEPDCPAMTLASTAGESMSWLGPFDTPAKWKRNAQDLYDPYTAQVRHDLYDVQDLGEAPVGVLPRAVSEVLDGNTRVAVDSSWSVTSTGADSARGATYISDKLGLTVVPDAGPSRYIHVHTHAAAPEHAQCAGNPEAYSVVVDVAAEIITVESRTDAGAFYGAQTVLSLLAEDGGAANGEVQDCPRYSYRGVNIDIGRNFHGMASVLKLLDAMAAYKFNKFHFHLADDEGWRVEIPGLEELTTVGAHRCHTTTGDDCILPQLGSGPDRDNDGSGFFTVEQYREILQYADDRNIEVIPEFDMPGHSHAAIHAMEARYRKYSGSDPSTAEEFRLIDPEDTSEYFSVQMFTDNSINPCIDSTYRFVEKVVEETIKLHEGIQDLKIFHFGGDEVPHTAWLQSPACHKLWEERPDLNYTRAMKGYFVMRTAEITARLGLDLGGWEDGFTDEGDVPFDRDLFDSENVYTMVWNNVWEWGAGKHAYQQANAGYLAVLAHATHMYYDHPHEPEPDERGYYWATRFIDSYKTFGYMPDRVYDNMAVGGMGNALDKEEICAAFGCPPLEKPENIVGMQGCLWTESVRKPEHFDNMLFPRLLALAERAWHKASWEDTQDEAQRLAEMHADWERFANIVGYKELARLEDLGIAHHMRPPGFVNPDGSLSLQGNTEFPGQAIQLSEDAGATWRDYVPGETGSSGATYHVRVRSSRHVQVQCK